MDDAGTGVWEPLLVCLRGRNDAAGIADDAHGPVQVVVDGHEDVVEREQVDAL